MKYTLSQRASVNYEKSKTKKESENDRLIEKPRQARFSTGVLDGAVRHDRHKFDEEN